MTESRKIDEGKIKVRKKGKVDELSILEKQLEEKSKITEDSLTKLKYLQAEFENYRKRVAKGREEIIKFANEGLIIKLLDVYENLERAIENGRKAEDKEALLKGIEMTYKQFKDALGEEGLAEINAMGEKFDPFKHEVIAEEANANCEENTIVEEYQKGYILKDKVIRYSKVKVSKKGESKED